MNSIQNKADNIGNLIKTSIPFLKDFVYNGFQDKNDLNIWFFVKKFPDYKFNVFFAEKNEKWKAKLIVHWKKHTNHHTSGAGKDFHIEIGPHKNFENIITDIERKFTNNPIMGSNVYEDDYLLNMDTEAVPLMKKLKNIGQELFKIKDPYFDDLKQIYIDIEKMSEDRFLAYCRTKHKTDMQKQDFLLDLQKMDKLNFYHDMLNLRHIS